MSEQTSENTELEINSPESWENAKAYAAIMGAVPSSFSSTIRMLVLGHLKNEDDWKARFQVIRLLKGPTMKSIFYHAAKTFRPNELEQNPQMNIKDIVKLFAPLDLAGLLATIYLFRRAHKIVSEKDSFETLADRLLRESEIGGHLGDAIPPIGFGTGLLIGGIRHLAMAPLVKHDEEGYNKYLNHLQKHNLEIDLVYEASRWNCTSLQIASILLQSTGFGIEVAQGVVNGLDPRLSIDDVPDTEQYRVKITKVWIDSLTETGDQPKIKMRGEFYPMKDAFDILHAHSQQVVSSGSKYGWLKRTKEDLPEDQFPHLYPRKKAEQATSEVDSGTSQEDKEPVTYPDELLEFFSESELQEMSQTQIDEMVKQVDLG